MASKEPIVDMELIKTRTVCDDECALLVFKVLTGERKGDEVTFFSPLSGSVPQQVRLARAVNACGVGKDWDLKEVEQPGMVNSEEILGLAPGKVVSGFVSWDERRNQWQASYILSGKK